VEVFILPFTAIVEAVPFGLNEVNLEGSGECGVLRVGAAVEFATEESGPQDTKEY
jgi:hypothetical protein